MTKDYFKEMREKHMKELVEDSMKKYNPNKIGVEKVIDDSFSNATKNHLREGLEESIQNLQRDTELSYYEVSNFVANNPRYAIMAKRFEDREANKTIKDYKQELPEINKKMKKLEEEYAENVKEVKEVYAHEKKKNEGMWFPTIEKKYMLSNQSLGALTKIQNEMHILYKRKKYAKERIKELR